MKKYINIQTHILRLYGVGHFIAHLTFRFLTGGKLCKLCHLDDTSTTSSTWLILPSLWPLYVLIALGRPQMRR